MKRFALAFVCICMALVCCQKEPPAKEPEVEVIKDDDEEEEIPELIYKAPANNEFRCIMDYPSYRGVTKDKLPDEYLEKVDVVLYAFLKLNDDLSVTLQEPGKLMTLVSRCHAKGIKVILAFSGNSSSFKKMAAKASTRKRFVEQAVKIVDQYNLDGLDNDWEHPSSNDDSKINNLYLMRMLSNEMHSPKRNKLLVMALVYGKWPGGYREGIHPGVYDCCDWFGSMSYSSATSSDKPETYDAMKVMEISYNWWVVTSKMPASKFVLGIPLYGTDPYTNPESNMGYASILKNGGSPDEDVFSFTGTDGKKHTYYYDGRPTVRAKVKEMMKRGCGGYSFWEGSYDSFDERSLLKTAWDAAHD